MANKYIFQLRRGWKWDADPDTGLPRNDWETYDAKPDEERVDPLAGELVVEYDNGIPRLKIGDGKTKFSELPYMSVDSFILPTPTTINLFGGVYWKEVPDFKNRYTQDITNQLVGKITANSKVDLQPTPEQLYAFQAHDLTLTTVNENGQVRVCAIGPKPTATYRNIQVTITEVVGDE